MTTDNGTTFAGADMGDAVDPGAVWAALAERHPLILCITNRVTTQRVADLLLAAGAAPVMADNPDEVAQMAAIASGVYLNAGLHATQPAALDAAATAFETLATTRVLDPVGIGATAYRTAVIGDLVRRVRFDAIRGNAAEIAALSGAGTGTRGVDAGAGDTAEGALAAAAAIARERGTVVAVSGETDVITDGTRVARVGGGHPWLARITGTGCALGALVTACVAASDPWAGTITAHAALSLATDRAMRQATGPGTLSVYLLDALTALRPEDFAGADIGLDRLDEMATTA